MRIWRNIWKFEREFHCEEFLRKDGVWLFCKRMAQPCNQILFPTFDSKVLEKFTFKFFTSFLENFDFSINHTSIQEISYHASRSCCREQKPAFVDRMHNFNFSVWQNTLEPGTTKESITAARDTFGLSTVLDCSGAWEVRWRQDLQAEQSKMCLKIALFTSLPHHWQSKIN